jgi:hypothetical protein
MKTLKRERNIQKWERSSTNNTHACFVLQRTKKRIGAKPGTCPDRPDGGYATDSNLTGWLQHLMGIIFNLILFIFLSNRRL